jgi:hypothetical protein
VLSGAGIEAVLMRARMRSTIRNAGAVTQAVTEAVTQGDLKAVFEDFLPPFCPAEIELQAVVAGLECTSRSFLAGQSSQRASGAPTGRGAGPTSFN